MARQRFVERGDGAPRRGIAWAARIADAEGRRPFHRKKLLRADDAARLEAKLATRRTAEGELVLDPLFSGRRSSFSGLARAECVLHQYKFLVNGSIQSSGHFALACQSRPISMLPFVNRALRFLGVLLLLYIPLPFAFAGLSEVVACLNSDGDIAVEATHEGRCFCALEGVGDEDDSGAGPFLSAEADSCNGCICLPLSPARASNLERPAKQCRLKHSVLHARAWMVQDAVRSGLPPSKEFTSEKERAPQHSFTILALRTIVLRA